MAKFKLKKPSKRQPARRRYKIEKKIREHNRKIRKDNKKNPNKGKNKIVQIPNICPFKEDILKEVEEMKKHRAQELRRQQDEALKRKEEAKKQEQPTVSLENLVNKAEMQAKLFEKTSLNDKSSGKGQKLEQSLKQFHKEFVKVIEAADVILEVLDARDPLGTKNSHVEEAVLNAKGDKKLVLILNKADLVPRNILEKWVNYLKRSFPVIPFKASTQQQNKKLGHRKMSKNEKGMQGSACIGAELIMSCLGNFCRNKDIKTSIRVGVVGLPNVGKSSVINSLKRSRACNVGAVPGITKTVQEVHLDSKIILLDCPGIVFAQGSDNMATLKNIVKISSLDDPITPAKTILQRFSKKDMMELYDIKEYSTPEEFFSLKSIRTGKFKKGGIPDLDTAAKGLLNDWNSGKIRYYTLPPEDSQNVHVGAAVVSENVKEFDIDSLEIMETNFTRSGDNSKSFLVESFASQETQEKMEEDEDLMNDKVVQIKRKKTETTGREKKKDAEMELEGNQKLNKLVKLKFKKEKKKKNRIEKVATELSKEMSNVAISKESEDYSFDDFVDA